MKGQYEFDKKLRAEPFTIEVSTGDLYGYFEHDDYGDAHGGGLWFYKNRDGVLELLDYDGVAVLPMRVIKALREAGFFVGEEFE